jgi:hypothetical protein
MLSAERGWGGGAGADGGVGRARDSFSRIAARNQPLSLICQNLSEFADLDVNQNDLIDNHPKKGSENRFWMR